jgi:hypothetical protein
VAGGQQKKCLSEEEPTADGKQPTVKEKGLGIPARKSRQQTGGREAVLCVECYVKKIS